ncbi:MAG: hypothetical protein JXQ96_00795 [Cyclobacteriaceae bacterium]
MKYSFRKSAFDKDKTYELTQTSISITDHEGRTTDTPYSDIETVNLQFVSTKNNSFYQCELKLKNGSKILLKSQHYKGIANFEDRKEEYSLYISGLHKILNASKLDIKYKKGISPVAYFLSMAIFILTGFLFPIIAIVMLIGGQLLFGLAGLFVGIMLILKMLKYAKKNKPGTYSPDDLPESLLPDY